MLLLRLEGPMQSWGIRARWDVRDSGPEPTKSGVVGLLGCALGLERRNPRLEELDRALRFAVRTDRPGTIATDYHTVTGRHRMANGKLKSEEYTVQSLRDYLYDAAYLVVLGGDAGLLEQIEKALRTPRWPLYLGRKSCVPTRPVCDRMSDDYDELDEAMLRAPWSAPWEPRIRRTIARTFTPETVPESIRSWSAERDWEQRGPEYRLQSWVEDPAGGSERQDAIRSNDLRFYEFRRCRHLSVPIGALEVME